MKWTNAELNDRLGEYFEIRNKKYLIGLPGLNRLLVDSRCPNAQESNLVEYLIQIKEKLEVIQKSKRLQPINHIKNNDSHEYYRKTA